MNKPAVEMVATDKLIPYARNAKKHDEAQVSLIAGSIRQFGFCNPVLIAEDNGIVAGHGRVLAAMKLGMAEVPCIRLSHLDENQRRAYILADNRLAELGGGWDLDMLAAEMDALGEVEIDVGELGFDEAFLSLMDLTETESEVDAEAQIDKAEELRVKWGVETGQLWQLGEHRLICGDCTDKAVVDRLMGGEKADMVFTDPPYNVNAESRSKKRGLDKIENDNIGDGEYQSLLSKSFENLAEFSKSEAPHYYWHNYKCQSNFEDALSSCGLKIRNQIVWVKDIPSYSNNEYRQQHELCFYCHSASVDRPLYFGEKATSVWNVPSVQSAKSVGDDGTSWFKGGSKTLNLHVTQKPLPLAERGISNSSEAGDIVADFFSGSGTTLIACERLGRKCRAVEISPAYVAVAIQRWVDVTGGTPELVD